MNTFATLSLKTPNGTFVFSEAEVPEGIRFGGQQLMSVHQLQSGLRKVFPMGASDIPLSWSGWFLYASAVDRARFLDSVRRAGQLCTLSWDAFLFDVVISDFRPNYLKPFKIPYTITFEVVQDRTQLIRSVPAVTPQQAIQLDMARVTTLSACIGDSTLNSLAGDLQSTFDAVSNAVAPIANGLKAVTTFIAGVANCAEQVANTVLNTVSQTAAPLAAFNSHIASLVSSAEGVAFKVGTFGGVVPGSSIVQAIAASVNQAGAMAQLPELYELRSVGVRLQTNLGLISSPASPKKITVGGGNLYDLAAQQYGDASRWIDIASANGLTDPVLSGINTLTIPA